MNVKRITLTGAKSQVAFGEISNKWLVKNLSENDVFVSFDADAAENAMIKIPKGMGQVVVDNEIFENNRGFGHTTIYLQGTGEIEVQQLCFQ